MYQAKKAEWVDGHSLHLRVAQRMYAMPRPSDWRSRRELGLVLTIATFAPLVVCAFEAESPSVVIGLFMLATVTAGALLVHWIQTEYLIRPLSVRSGLGVGPNLSLATIPRMHFGERGRAKSAKGIGFSRAALKR